MWVPPFSRASCLGKSFSTCQEASSYFTGAEDTTSGPHWRKFSRRPDPRAWPPACRKGVRPPCRLVFAHVFALLPALAFTCGGVETGRADAQPSAAPAALVRSGSLRNAGLHNPLPG